MKWNILFSSETGTGRPKNNDEIVRILLANRGLKDPAEIDDFLGATFRDVTPETVGIDRTEMKKAAQRIRRAVEKKESIVVYTDYDADGVSAGAIVWETIHDLGGQVMPYIPHREGEGYGFSTHGIDAVRKEYNASLLIAVDHGISAQRQIAYAKSLGMDTIILDHHSLPKKLPGAVSIVHTTQLAAGGIALLFGKFLREYWGQSYTQFQKESHMELAMLATIADLMPLTHANRVIVKEGLMSISHTKRPGFQSLISISGLSGRQIGVYEISHMLAPRINALGRMSHAIDALRLLCTRDGKRAAGLAEQMEITNRERQMITEECVNHARFSLEKNGSNNRKLIFLSDESYKPGVIGLVAGKLAQQFHQPAIVVSIGEKYSKASGRSIPGFDIISMLRQADSLLLEAGGHPMAAGFTVETKSIDRLQQALHEIADRELTGEMLAKSLTIDTQLDLETVSYDFLRSIQSLAPFGNGNPHPVFASFGAQVQHASKMGKEGTHMKLKLHPQESSQAIEAVGFGMGGMYDAISRSSAIDIAYTVDENTWMGSSRLQLKLLDVRIPNDSA